MDINKKILSETSHIDEYVINMRRLIHVYAEVGGEEVKTSALVKTALAEEGIPYIKLVDTAVIGIFDTGKPGPGIVLRADMDALPMKENQSNLKGRRSVISETGSTFHGCGHDSHTAMLLGSMKVLNRMKDELCGTVYFCFEEGEECGKSGQQIVDTLKNYNIDTVWAIHVSNVLKTGQISVEPGIRMAGVAGVSILVRGRGGHGSRPDLSVNPVFTAASILINASGAFVNQLHPEKPVTFGITTIQGGGISNIFPDIAEILGTLRFFDLEEGEKAIEILKKVAKHTAAMNNCEVEFGTMMKLDGIPVVNDEKYAAIAQRGLAEVLPKGSIVPLEREYGSESFSRYTAAFPGVFANLGINNPMVGSGAPLHNEFFDVDETALKTGVISTVKYTLSCMQEYSISRIDD